MGEEEVVLGRARHRHDAAVEVVPICSEQCAREAVGLAQRRVGEVKAALVADVRLDSVFVRRDALRPRRDGTLADRRALPLARRADQLGHDERVAGREITRVAEGGRRTGRPGSWNGRRADVRDEEGDGVRVGSVELGEIGRAAIDVGRACRLSRGVGVRGAQRHGEVRVDLERRAVLGPVPQRQLHDHDRKIVGEVVLHRRAVIRRLVLEDDAVWRPAVRPRRRPQRVRAPVHPHHDVQRARLAALPVVRAPVDAVRDRRVEADPCRDRPAAVELHPGVGAAHLHLPDLPVEPDRQRVRARLGVARRREDHQHSHKPHHPRRLWRQRQCASARPNGSEADARGLWRDASKRRGRKNAGGRHRWRLGRGKKAGRRAACYVAEHVKAITASPRGRDPPPSPTAPDEAPPVPTQAWSEPDNRDQLPLGEDRSARRGPQSCRRRLSIRRART